jgi:hypothetical protein
MAAPCTDHYCGGSGPIQQIRGVGRGVGSGKAEGIISNTASGKYSISDFSTKFLIALPHPMKIN